MGVVDPSRIWIQVKGTESLGFYRTKGGDLRYSVSVRHALRWLRHFEPVLFVLWNTEAAEGRWALVRGCFIESDLILNKNKTIQITIPAGNVLSEHALKGIEWEARTAHFEKQLIINDCYERRMRHRSAEDPQEKRNVDPLAVLTVLDFLTHIGIAHRDGDKLDSRFCEMCRSGEKMLREKEGFPESESLAAAAALVLMGHLEKQGGQIGEILLECTANVIASYLLLEDNLPAVLEQHGFKTEE